MLSQWVLLSFSIMNMYIEHQIFHTNFFCIEKSKHHQPFLWSRIRWWLRSVQSWRAQMQGRPAWVCSPAHLFTCDVTSGKCFKPSGLFLHGYSSVQLHSHVQLFATAWTTAHQASLSLTNSQSLLKLMFIESVMASSHLILCGPLFLLLSIFPSIRVFSNESALYIMWPKYWSFSFSVSPSTEYSGPISFRIDWLDLLVVQGILKNLLQHHSSKALILWCSAFFIVQLSHPYMTTGKTRALTRRTLLVK